MSSRGYSSEEDAHRDPHLYRESPPLVSKSIEDNENVPYPGSRARPLVILDNDDDDKILSPIPRARKVEGPPPTVPVIMRGPATGKGLITQETLSQLNISMGGDGTFHQPVGPLRVCRFEDILLKQNIRQTADKFVRQSLSLRQSSKRLLNFNNKRPQRDERSPESAESSSLPFKHQHTVLNIIQKFLEEACFYFAQKWLPDLLKKKGWEIPEQGELHLWWRNIKNHRVPAHAVNFGDLDVESLSRQVGKICGFSHPEEGTSMPHARSVKLTSRFWNPGQRNPPFYGSPKTYPKSEIEIISPAYHIDFARSSG